MLNTKEEQITLLDTLFTQKDLYFLNSLDEEIKLIEKQIPKQGEKRKVIVDVINYCESALLHPTADNISDFSYLLTESKKALALIDFNIKSLLSFKQDLGNINSTFSNLLVAIESNTDNNQIYMSQVDDLRKAIEHYSTSCVNIKTEISNNDLALNGFLNNSKFISIFKNMANLEQPSTVVPSSEGSTTVVKDISNIVDDIYNNNVLKISEKENKVYLPYNHHEIESYLVQFSEDYQSAQDVIQSKFVFPLEHYIKHPVLSRFREAYSLIRDKEAKSAIEAVKYSMNLMFTYELNPTIIAACKTQEQLENYLDCLESNNLDNFKDFEIKFEISPL